MNPCILLFGKAFAELQKKGAGQYQVGNKHIGEKGPSKESIPVAPSYWSWKRNLRQLLCTNTWLWVAATGCFHQAIRHLKTKIIVPPAQEPYCWCLSRFLCGRPDIFMESGFSAWIWERRIVNLGNVYSPIPKIGQYMNQMEGKFSLKFRRSW